MIYLSPPLALNRLFLSERFGRIINDTNVIDRYFDGRLTKEIFERYSKNLYRPIASALSVAIKQGSSVYVAATGLFYELANKYDPELLSSLLMLAKTERLKVGLSTLYGGLYGLCEGSEAEIQDQVKVNAGLVEKFGIKPEGFAVMPFFMYNANIERGLKGTGVQYLITEEFNGFNDHRFVYTSQGGELKILSRNRNASLALQSARFEEVKGADGVLAIRAENISGKGQQFVEVLANYIFNGGLNLADIENSVLSPSGTLYVPNGFSIYDLELGTNPAWSSNLFQRILTGKLCQLLEYIRSVGDAKLLQIWRLLMQGDALLSMDGSIPDSLRLVADSEEAKLLISYLVGDFEGRVANTVLRKRAKTLNSSQP